LSKKLQKKSEALKKYAAQYSALMIKQSNQDQLMFDIKERIINQSGLSLSLVQKMEQEADRKSQQGIERVPVNLKLDPQHECNKRDLTKLVNREVQRLNHNYDMLYEQLE
jgi:hypothetical protein